MNKQEFIDTYVIPSFPDSKDEAALKALIGLLDFAPTSVLEQLINEPTEEIIKINAHRAGIAQRVIDTKVAWDAADADYRAAGVALQEAQRAHAQAQADLREMYVPPPPPPPPPPPEEPIP